MAGHNLACAELERGHSVAAIRLWRLSASGGDKGSMNNLILFFEAGSLRHGDLAETLRVFYRSRGELQSEDRDKYIEHLKKTGEYKEEYNL